MFFALASLGLPGLANFVGEFLIFLGAFRVFPVLTIIATVGAVFATVYALWMVYRTFHGTPAPEKRLAESDVREMAVLSALGATLLWIGFFPQTVLNTAGPALDGLQSEAGITIGISSRPAADRTMEAAVSESVTSATGARPAERLAYIRAIRFARRNAVGRDVPTAAELRRNDVDHSRERPSPGARTVIGIGGGSNRMGQVSAYVNSAWAIVLYLFFILFIVGMMVMVPRFLGERHRERATEHPYESGIESTGSARIRVDVQFYLVAVVFLMFDVETAFILSWAIAFKRLGWGGVAAIVVFIGLFALMLVYLVRVGALEWGSRARERKRKW